MILSASGWRKVFAVSQDEQDKSPQISEDDKALCVVAAGVFFDYLVKTSGQKNPVIAVGMDTRPTGAQIADAVLHSLISKDAIIQFTGIISAPEIMAFAKKLDGFIYISASHNPVGHNGIKFGINDGGVLSAQENQKLICEFTERLKNDTEVTEAVKKAYNCSSSRLNDCYKESEASKFNARNAYQSFAMETITGTKNKEYQTDFFEMFQNYLKEKPIGVLCDFNGSSRYYSIDRDFFYHNRINFYTMNEQEIVHEIIPEGDNLLPLQQGMQELQEQNYKDVILGYMPDCDGDRGNLVYWNEKENKAVILKAQEVFSLSVLAELTYSIWQHTGEKDFKPAVVVNCPTSGRIDEIAQTLGAKVFRAEVGEANVVNLARQKRDEGYDVRILGEGSNGGTITYPASVRDPLNTIFAIIKLLTLREEGLFKMWCDKRKIDYNPLFTITDILQSLPEYVTTGVSEERALLKIKTEDHAKLKANFQKIFERQWEQKLKEFKNYKIKSYEAVITNGTVEQTDVKDFSLSNRGGLKIILKDSSNKPAAFLWMRGSGTERVFRILCDVRGNKPEFEQKLCEWLSSMLYEADK
ncbi:MAG: phosphoglucomutase [Treponema sp.]|nr:phosphoglucomutase [Treponema sp.]